MSGNQRPDYANLRWIQEGLEESLQRARQALGAWEEARFDPSLLQPFLEQVRQLLGTLRMVQVYGGAMVLEEVQQVGTLLREGSLQGSGRLAECMMLVLLQLPGYLKRLEQGQPDVPLALLPVLNDLRAARGMEPATEIALYAPNLDRVVEREPVVPGSGNPAIPGLVRRLRNRYHHGLLAWYRGKGELAGLDLVLDVVRQVNAAAGTHRLRRLMDAVEALIVTLIDGEFTADNEVKRLFSRLDRVFHDLIEGSEESVMERFPMELLKNILYCVSRSHSDASVVQSIKRTADLANSFPENIQTAQGQQSSWPVDQEVISAVAEQLLENLHRVQEGLDLFKRGDHQELHHLQGLSGILQKVTDTLGMLGRGDLRERLLGVGSELEMMENGQATLDNERLMQIAVALVEVESALGRLPQEREAEVEDTKAIKERQREEQRQQVLREAARELAHIKERLEGYLRDPSDSGRLLQVKAEAHKLAGVFSVAELLDVAQLLGRVEPELQRLAESQKAPTSQEQSALVDLFAALDYYLEARLEGRGGLKSILEQAGQALDLLSGAVEAQEGELPPEFRGEQAISKPKPTEEAKVIPLHAGAPGKLVSEQPPVSETVAEAEVGEEEPGAAEATAKEQPALVEMDEIDPEIFDIFMEEAGEELEVINSLYPRWRADQSEHHALETFRRSFHTLKGSGRMVGANVIGEFSWSIENLLNRIMDGTVEPDSEILSFLDEAVAAVPVLIEAQREGKPAQVDVASLEERAFKLAEPRPVAREEEPAESGTEEMMADEALVDAEAAEPEEGTVEPPPPAIEIDPDLHVIFRGESEVHLGVVQRFLSLCGDQCDVGQELVRALHTLRGSSHLAEIESMASLAGEMEIYFKHLRQLGQPCGESEKRLLGDFHDVMRELLDAVNKPGSVLPDWEKLLIRIREADAELPEVVSELVPSGDSEFLQEASSERDVLNSYLEETAATLNRLYLPMSNWVKSGSPRFVDDILRELHELKSDANSVGLASLSDLLEGLESYFALLEQTGGEVDIDTRRQLGRLVESVEDALDGLHLNGRLPDLQLDIDTARRLVDQLEAVSRLEEEEPSSMLEEEAQAEEPESILLSEAWEGESNFHPESASLDEAPSPPEPPAKEQGRPFAVPDVDPELLEVFLEEAGELVEQLDENYQEWQQDITSHEAIDGLMRSLHTLKGNARFAGLFALGDLSHVMESLFEGLSEGRLVAEQRLQPLVRAGLDRLANSVELLQHGNILPDLTEITRTLEAAAAGEAWEMPSVLSESELTTILQDTYTVEIAHSGFSEILPSSEPVMDSSFIFDSQVLTDSELMGETEPSGGDKKVVPFPGGNIRKRGDRQRPPPLQAEEARTDKGERVRVLAELLDQLVNNAGEVSIYRARLERQNMRIQHNLEELNATIFRLRNQLRALELETEAQIRSRHEREQEEGKYEDFDPLEMDRYSTLQQLSRALSETINDLSELGESLGEQARDTDTLLLQQARVTNDLQDGLLRSRMVPFKRQATRLQRVVRQTANALGKRAELNVVGADGEIDRTILNRIMGPLEHLLRNAVAHGIEPLDQRRAQGKPEVGKVSLVLAREGSEVVITISDDGAGLNTEAIREKAIQSGLLEPNAEVDEEEIHQFILQPGFSTATEVTQVAGRGVGMDVVVAEIKQLGGSLEILSQRGQGSSFVIRLPFTLAISEALLVEVGEETYAIPHGSTEVIIRTSREELLDCYQGRSEGIEYGGNLYPVRYLGSLLGIGEPRVPDNLKWQPLLLVRAGERRMAIHIDRLLGNQQVVVKSIGSQLAGVQWFTGGTILADGKIALLLDMGALVRSAAVRSATAKKEAEAAAETADQGITVMVVDDSITVRKVTTRLLERHNMQVITAKDGVDAITVLQDHKPNVMLLDIEMPRMDGYELARHIRNTPDLEDIPIIMITSRTGEKHRNRALELGVNRYLGKPYQEADLLENIYELLGERVNG